MASSGQAVTHLASSQDLQARVKLNMGVMRTTYIWERNGFMLFFSRAQAYSHILRLVHLLGSTETIFLDENFEAGISITRDDLDI